MSACSGAEFHPGISAPPRGDAHSELELASELALVMQRNDRQLQRTAWRILRNREDAEDAVQSAYLNALAGISGFAGRSTLSTWLTRIVTNAALAHARLIHRRRTWLEEPTSIAETYCETLMRGSIASSPERAYAHHQILQLINDAIDRLPPQFRTVFVLRQIEELDVGEIAELLGINTATVKTRHLRARRRLQRALAPALGAAPASMFPFAGDAREHAVGRSPQAAMHGDWSEARGEIA